MKRLLSFSMKRQTPVAALGALVLSIVLSGCEKPDLRLEQVQIDWGAGAKTVTARISNYGSADAGRFVVRFVGEELPQSAGSAPQVLRDVPGLDNGTDLLVTADFTPLASAANSDLWHVRRIAVQVDANREVSEKREDNNDGGRNVLNSDLPVVIVDPFGISIPIEPKTPAAFRIIDDSSASNNYNGAVGIEVRGASSSTFCQKQYGLEVWEAANDDDDVDIPLLGMPKEEDWVLHGPYTDKTLLRNALVYQVSNAMGRYAPQTRFVEAFVKDPGLAKVSCPTLPPNDYAGVFVFMERIKRDANRVAVTPLSPSQNAEPEIRGGYILKIDWPGTGDVYFTTALGTRITYVYPKGTEITVQQQNWVQAYMNGFEAALHGSNFTDPVNGYAKYIDVDSFVDYYLLEELFKNYDAFRASTYMYKDRKGKLFMGPVWDFNAAMGQAITVSNSATSGWIRGAVSGQPFWWNRLVSDPAFVQKLNDRWQLHRSGPLATATLLSAIDALSAQVTNAQVRHFQRWPLLGTKVWGEPVAPSTSETYASVVQNLKAWIQARAAWMDMNLKLL